MKIHYLLLVLFGMISCGESSQNASYSSVDIHILYQDSISFRALEVMEGSVAFAGSGGVFGNVDTRDYKVRTGRMEFEGNFPEFRSVAHTTEDFFMLSAGDPALLYKTGDKGAMELVYQEHGPGVFYDSMAFWDDLNGLAVGDAINGCLSILITRDGGYTWTKLPCENLPTAIPGEGAFAASDTNIAIKDGRCWIATSKSRIFYSSDKGDHWQVWDTPAQGETDTRGLYSLDFLDSQTGFAIGGDYTNPEDNRDNKIVTLDGGQSWKVVASGLNPGYKSCVQFVPERKGRELIATGFTGISYSADGGSSWVELSEEGFYSFRFLDQYTAVASGKGRIALLRFR